MPHVVIRGPVDLAAYASHFKPLLIRRGGDVLRAERIFVDGQRRTALVESLVIEAGRKLPFYVKISAHDRGSTTLRIDPLTHVERSDGVKELVAALGADVLASTPGADVEVTNLVLPSPTQGRGGTDEDRE